MAEELLSVKEFAYLRLLTFREGYTGYTPNILESPNGDGYLDEGKQYSHITRKNINQSKDFLGEVATDNLEKILHRLYIRALEVAVELGVPVEFWPDADECCLRILEYPPGVGSGKHKDFFLFTMNLYRNMPGKVKAHEGRLAPTHYGEILSLVCPIYQAPEHWVEPDKLGRTQYSAVFFAMPRPDALLPPGLTVANWVAQRKARSRKAVDSSST